MYFSKSNVVEFSLLSSNRILSTLERFSSDTAADIQIFYVDDEHRGTTRADHLKHVLLDDSEQGNDQLVVFFPLKHKLPRPSL